MITVLNDNMQVNAPKLLETRSGPWASVAAANAGINPAYRVKGLTVFIITAGVAVEYWYKNGIADGDLIAKASSGSDPLKADLVAGKVPAAQLPSFAIGESFPAASQVAMLALDAQIGDVAIRSDQANAKYMLLGNDPTVLANWSKFLANPIAATDITQDATHRFVTDAEKVTWNAGGGGGAGVPVSFINAKSAPFNAVGDGVADDTAALQAAIDFAIANNVEEVFLPYGDYMTTSSVISHKWDEVEEVYKFHTIRIQGEDSFWNTARRTTIRCTSKNTPVFISQLGKGCKLRNVGIVGNYVAPTGGTERDFYNMTRADFVANDTSRDSRYSPQCGVAIDYFTDVAPADGGNPDLLPFYRGGAGTSGSTGFEMEDCTIFNCVVGFITSVNATTQNAEIMILNKIQFGNCITCIAGTQPQEKANNATNIHCWGATYEIFNNTTYGDQQAGNWFFDILNLAGRVVQVCDAVCQGLFPVTFSRIYGESTQRIGVAIGCYFDRCFIDFQGFNVSGFGQGFVTGGNGNGSTFTNCRFRYYGYVGGMPLVGQHIFDNCEFSGLPIAGRKSLGYVSRSKYKDCKVVNYGGDIYILGKSFNENNYQEYIATNEGVRYMYGLNGVNTPDYQRIIASSDAIIVDGAGNGTLEGYGFMYHFRVGDMIGFSDGAKVSWGKVTANDGTDVTFGGLAKDVVLGTNYTLIGAYDLLWFGNLLGDFTNGNKFITNAAHDTGKSGADIASRIGRWFYHPYSNAGYYRFISVAGTTITLGYDQDSALTITHAIINNGITQKRTYQSAAAWAAEGADLIIGVNDIIVINENSDAEVRYKCTRSGFKANAPAATLELQPGTIPDATTLVRGKVFEAVDQPDSAAADIATIVEDFNSLLSKMRTAGLLEAGALS